MLNFAKSLSNLGKLVNRLRHPQRPQPRARYVVAPEQLEPRLLLYVTTGSKWANTNISVSYMPDGTYFDGYQSNLFSLYDAKYATATWQREFAQVLQTWANVTPLNFRFVSDNGSFSGVTGLVQGDSRFGDIRLGATLGTTNLGIGYAPSGTITKGGDIRLNGYGPFFIGSNPDLYSVLLHESGHALGLSHSTVTGAIMTGYKYAYGLTADDIAGIQSLYGTRRPDSYDAVKANDGFASASTLSLVSGAATFKADLTSIADVDYYRVTVPSGSDGTLTVSVDARNYSLLDPKVSVYDSALNLVATSSGVSYGTVATVNLTGLTAGQTYYLVADGATNDVFGMGGYNFSAKFGGVTTTSTNTSTNTTTNTSTNTSTLSADRYEVNNAFASAKYLGSFTSRSDTGLTLHAATDVDYYSFSAAKSGTYVISMAPTSGSGSLSLTALNGLQQVLTTNELTGSVSLSVALSSGQLVYVKAQSPSGSLVTYNLSISKLSSSKGASGKGGALTWEGVFDTSCSDCVTTDDHDHETSTTIENWGASVVPTSRIDTGSRDLAASHGLTAVMASPAAALADPQGLAVAVEHIRSALERTPSDHEHVDHGDEPPRSTGKAALDEFWSRFGELGDRPQEDLAM